MPVQLLNLLIFVEYNPIFPTTVLGYCFKLLSLKKGKTFTGAYIALFGKMKQHTAKKKQNKYSLTS